MRKFLHRLLVSILAGMAALSCSTTRSLSPGQYRLTEAKIKVENDKKFKTKQIDSYIRQKPSGGDPLLFVYNWANPKTNNFMDRFFRKIGTPPVVYDPDMVNSSIDNIKTRLDYLGYYNSKVVADIKVKGKKAKVKYLVTLGKRYPIRDIEIVLPSRGEFASDFYADSANFTIHKGDWLSEAALEEETVRGSAYFRKTGYYGFNKNYYFFEADTLSHPGEALLKMTVNEYTRNETPKSARLISKYDFGDVDIYYPKELKVREGFLKRINTIKPGNPYSEPAVNNAYSRLSSLRMLSSVNIELEDKDSSVVDCQINLTPAKMQGFKVKLEASSNSTGLLGISPELSWYHKNIFHGSEMLNLAFMGNFQFRPKDKVKATEFGVSAGISLPRFIGLPYRFFEGNIPNTEIKASFNFQSRPEFIRTIISTSFGYSGSHRNLYYQVYPIKVSVVRLLSIDYDFLTSLVFNPFMANSYIDHFDAGAAGNLHYTTNSDLNPKTSYQYVNLSVNIAGNLLSLFNPLMKTNPDTGHRRLWNIDYSQYVRAELTLGKTLCFGANEDHAFAMRFIAGVGYAYGNSSTLPFEQHFSAGGANSMRGWQARSVGPGFDKGIDFFIIPSQTGDMKLEADLEYRFPIFWKFKGAAFAEAGNVWNIQGGTPETSFDAQNLFKSLAVDWGVGLRLDLDFILVRLDLGIQLYNPARDEGSRWMAPKIWFKTGNFALHFGVGYPF